MFYVIDRYTEHKLFRGTFDSCMEWMEARGLTEGEQYLIDWID